MNFVMCMNLAKSTKLHFHLKNFLSLLAEMVALIRRTEWTEKGNFILQIIFNILVSREKEEAEDGNVKE